MLNPKLQKENPRPMQSVADSGPRVSLDSAGPTSDWSTQTITTREELEALAPLWNELLEQSRSNSIFLTWEWISGWLDAVYPEAPLSVVCVRDTDGRLIALAPFYLSELRLLGTVKYRTLRVIGDCLSGAEYPDVIIRRNCEQQATPLIARSIRQRDTWDCAWIPNISGWTGAVERVESALGAASRYLHARDCSFSAIELPRTHNEYLSLLSKSFRSNIKRQESKLCTKFNVKLLSCESGSELPLYLETLFELHRKRWESAGQTGSFARKPPMERFYRRFAPEALKRGWLRIHALEVDGIIHAVEYGYVYDASYHMLQSGFDPAGPSGTGNVLRKWIIQGCIDEGLKFYDFLGGFGENKRHWRARERLGAHLFVGRGLVKNRLLFWKRIWPTGRYLHQGYPANQGRSYD